MDIAAIKNFALSFGVTGVPFNGVQNITQILERLSFTSVTHVETKEGSYTPNDDYLYLWQNIPASNAPNFIFIQTPTALNITITSANGTPIVNAVPANKLFMLCLPPGFVVSSVYVEGRAGVGTSPMAQGIEVQYFCIMAQAVF